MSHNIIDYKFDLETRKDGWTEDSLPLCVTFDSTFTPVLTVEDVFDGSSLPFNDNYTIQVLNGGWLDYDGSDYLVPNFDRIEDCEAKNAQFSELDGMRYTCLGPYFTLAEEKSPDSPYIKKVNQQLNGENVYQSGDSGWSNLGAIWDSDTSWEPVGYKGRVRHDNTIFVVIVTCHCLVMPNTVQG